MFRLCSYLETEKKFLENKKKSGIACLASSLAFLKRYLDSQRLHSVEFIMMIILSEHVCTVTDDFEVE